MNSLILCVIHNSVSIIRVLYLPVVFLAPSFQVSGVITLPSFFSPEIVREAIEAEGEEREKERFEIGVDVERRWGEMRDRNSLLAAGLTQTLTVQSVIHNRAC